MSVNGEGGRGQPHVCKNQQVFFFLKEKKMLNVLKRKNMYLSVILNFFPKNHTFQTIQNLLICILKNYIKKNYQVLIIYAFPKYLFIYLSIHPSTYVFMYVFLSIYPKGEKGTYWRQLILFFELLVYPTLVNPDSFTQKITS